MTHQNHQTNGASLEDCHTNFFALTDLCGIKWRKFANGERPYPSNDPLDDPILRSYSRCMQADILCVWRRVQSTKQENSDPSSLTYEINSSKTHPPLSLAAAKELWIFWYGEEPDLKDLVDADLLRVASNQQQWSGTWERGLTYECRSLLFKALHNLMERFVLTKDIVRFGKWFVQPCTSTTRILDKCSQHLSFSFTFFVHGDTVCASIDLREHPTVRPLTKEHITEAAAAFAVIHTNIHSADCHGLDSPIIDVSPYELYNNMKRSSEGVSTPSLRKVILAPFGMAGVLTGKSYKMSDPMAEKILEEWSSFFPLCHKEYTNVPPVVEVISGGHRMYHPAIYVLVTDLDELPEDLDIAAQPKSIQELSAEANSGSGKCLVKTPSTLMTNNLLKQQPQQQQPNVFNIPTLNGTPTIIVEKHQQQLQRNKHLNKTHNLTENVDTKYNNNIKIMMERTTLPSSFYYGTSTSSSFTCNTINTHAAPQAAAEMPERAWQDCLSSSLQRTFMQQNESVTTKSNNIDDNLTVMTNTENSSIQSSTSILNDGNLLLQQQKKNESFWGFVDPTVKTSCACYKMSAKSMATYDTNFSSTAPFGRNLIGDTLLLPAIGSPNTSSPHPQNSTVSQPTSIPSADHKQLTISPRDESTSMSASQQPPTPIDHLLDKNAPAPTQNDQHESKSITSSFMHNSVNFDTNATVTHCLATHFLNLENCSMTPTSQVYSESNPSTAGTITVKKFDNQLPDDVEDIKLESDANATATTATSTPTVTNTCIIQNTRKNSMNVDTTITGAMRDYLKFYCPPKLPVRNTDSLNNEESPKYEALYDFSSNDAWFNYTIKRFKPNDEPKPRRYLSNKNIYESHTHIKTTLPTAAPLYSNARLLALQKQQPDQQEKEQQQHHLETQQVSSSSNSGKGNTPMNTDIAVERFAALTTSNNSVSTILKCDIDTGNTNVTITTTDDNVANKEPNHSANPTYFNDVNIKSEMNLSPSKEKLNIGGNLYTAEGLNPSLNDLEQLFETSSNDECALLQLNSPPDSNNPTKSSSITTTIVDTPLIVLPITTATTTNSNNNFNMCLSNTVSCIGSFHSVNTVSTTTTMSSVNNNKQQTGNFKFSSSTGNASGNGNSTNSNLIVEDLTKMFPTPPSHEQHHPNSSPCQIDMNIIECSTTTGTTTSTNSIDAAICSFNKIKQECDYEAIEDWSYVFRPPKQSMFVGSSKYAPVLQLPSHTLPPIVLPAHLVYKPSNWKTQQKQHQQQQIKQQQQNKQHSSSALTMNYQLLQQHKSQILPKYQHHQQQHHQHLHELLSQTPGPSQLPRYNHNNNIHNTITNNNSTSLLLNQLNCPQSSLNHQQQQVQQQFMQRTPVGMSPMSPTLMRNSPLTQRHLPPPAYEMSVVSPATSTSSYLNKQFHSQETPQTPQSLNANTAACNLSAQQSSLQNLAQSIGSNCSSNLAMLSRDLPEVSSLLVNILLYDTALNVFRDHNFDSSTVCVCNADSSKVGNIRGADSGVYVPLPGSSFKPTSSAAAQLPRPSLESGIKLLNTFTTSTSYGGFIGNNNNSSLDSPGSMPGASSAHTNSSSSNSSSITTNVNMNGMHNSHQHITGYVDDDPVDCTCGFSAVVNRRLAYRAGLFYEDEQEITGCAQDPALHKKSSLRALILNLNAAFDPNNVHISSNDKVNLQADQTTYAIFDLLLAQCSMIQNSSSSIHRALHRHRLRLGKDKRKPFWHKIYNVLEYVDAHDLVCLALEQARLTNSHLSRMDDQQLSPFSNNNNKKFNSAAFNTVINSNSHLNATVHKWSFIPVGFQRSNKEIVHTMNSIQPMLQNAFHTKSRSAAGSKEATYTVSGPLTWRQFHRLAGRASGQCEPQPIPSVIVGHDKDWISVAPLAIHYWDKFLLEPYSYARDIVYLIMCPDNEYIIGKTRTYFKELSTTYELCKLGRHTPIRGWDGMLNIGPHICNTGNFSTALDEWLHNLTDSSLSEKLRYYAYAFQNLIGPYLNRIPSDKTLLQPPDLSGNSTHYTNRERPNSNASPISSSVISSANNNKNSNIDIDKSHSTPKLEAAQSGAADLNMDNNYSDNNNKASDLKVEAKPAIILGDPLGTADTLEDLTTPAIVLYVVEPFTFGNDTPELERLVCVALLRCYTELLNNIPESVRANLNIQLISLESILELGRTRNRKRFSDEIKALALSIFSQCRRHMLHTQHVKSLTGFGTAANMEVFLKSKDEKNRRAYRMYTPPYILAPMHEKNDKSDFLRASSSVMLRGLNEQKYSVMYCNYCMSEDQSWLLAAVTDDRGELLEKVCINIDVPNRLRRRKTPARRVGLKKLMDFILGLISQSSQPWRLVIGRIGRIGHSELKSWSYLLSKPHLQKASKQLKDLCKQCTLTYPPSILSACLVTLEPDAKLRVMPDQFTPDERFSQISMQNPLSTPQDVTCTHILVFPTSAVCLSFTRQFQNEPQVDLDNDFLNFEECEDENEGFTDPDFMGDLLEWEPSMSRLSNHGSPDRMEDNRSWQSASGNNFNSTQQQDVEEAGAINQQPLAVGYMVSTAPTGQMPSWFWSACPHLEDVCPVFLKTALHLHVPNIQTTDDILNSTNAHSSATDHPLDSTLTADVLRYVLEGYNALSWLALDSNTHDRLSCLPINVQTLMELYYLTAAIA